jgi:hypothetical protein
MARAKNSTALQLVTEDDPPPPSDHVPDRFESLFGVVGNTYSTTEGRKRSGLSSSSSVPSKPVATSAVMDFLHANEGWHTSLEITTRIGMKAGNVLTVLRQEGKILGEKKGHVYIYSRIENK